MSLTPDQLRAATTTGRRVACLAAPGSGKTRTLIARVLHLLERGVHPSEILCLTFTRKAAREMRGRLTAAEVPARVVRQVTLSTFHSWAASLLREFGEVLGIDPAFSIRDQQDSDDLVVFVGQELGLKFKSAKRLRQEERVRVRYDALMREARAIDYDGLETWLVPLLTDDATRRALQVRYGHVLVDETQDTSELQQAILDRLNPANLFVVGDASQSIYGFRGASVAGFVALTQRPGWEVIALATNFRSRPAIVEAATALGQAMDPPGLRQVAGRTNAVETGAVIDAGGTVCCLSTTEHGEEDRHWVLATVADHIADHIALGVPPSDLAVLAPTWRRLEELAPLLEARGVPVQIGRREVALWDGAEARWLVACLRVVVQPHDHLALWAALSAFAPRVRYADWVVARADAAGTGHPVEDHLVHEPELLRAIRLARDSHDPITLLTEALAGELHALHLDSRVEALDAVRAAAALWWSQEEEASVQTFLDWYGGRHVTEARVEDEPQGVQLTTVHGAKGLEWPYVWVLAAQEGDLPRSGGDVEEQRRLFYVALTRAAERVTFALWKEPSRFLEECGL